MLRTLRPLALSRRLTVRQSPRSDALRGRLTGRYKASEYRLYIDNLLPGYLDNTIKCNYNFGVTMSLIHIFNPFIIQISLCLLTSAHFLYPDFKMEIAPKATKYRLIIYQ